MGRLLFGRSQKDGQIRLAKKVRKHPALSLKNLVSQFNDESIGHNQVAQGLNVKQSFHFHARWAVLAEDGIGYCGRAGDARTAMYQDFSPGGKLTGKGENAFHVPGERAVRVAGIAGVVEKAKEQSGTRRDLLDLFSTPRVVLESFVPNRNNVRPTLAFLLS